MMYIHHLNCTTFQLRFARAFDGQRGFFDARLTCVTHCLLVETRNAGLVVVDTGFSTRDVEEPRRVSPLFHFVFRPPWKYEETVLAGMQRLGLSPKDVRHVLLTHLDYDHANGLEDFPWATAHVYAQELCAVRQSHTLRDRVRYNHSRLRSHTCWESYESNGGDQWYELPGVHPVKALKDEFAFVPLTGHSAGHCGVAVHTEHGWLLHAGDAYMQRAELQPAPDGPARTGLFQPVMQDDGAARQASLTRLAHLYANHAQEVNIFCAHDQLEFERLCDPAAMVG